MTMLVLIDDGTVKHVVRIKNASKPIVRAFGAITLPHIVPLELFVRPVNKFLAYWQHLVRGRLSPPNVHVHATQLVRS